MTKEYLKEEDNDTTSSSSTSFVNLYDLAASAISSSIVASIPIRDIAYKASSASSNSDNIDDITHPNITSPTPTTEVESTTPLSLDSFSFILEDIHNNDTHANHVTGSGSGSGNGSGNTNAIAASSSSPLSSNGCGYRDRDHSLRDSATSCISAADESSPTRHKRIHSRKKSDGTLITDADGASQQIIVNGILSVSQNIQIVGEESLQDQLHFYNLSKNQKNKNGYDNNNNYNIKSSSPSFNNEYEMNKLKKEMFQQIQKEITSKAQQAVKTTTTTSLSNQQEHPYSHVECSRVSVYIDPLDGTKSYAMGRYDIVSILVGIVLDDMPVFGVICKPFGIATQAQTQTSVTSNNSQNRIRKLMNDCFTVYGGLLVNGAYTVSSSSHQSSQIIHPSPSILDTTTTSTTKTMNLPRAVISKSRAGGIVGQCIKALSHNNDDQNSLDPKPLLIDGAGEKALRLILSQQNECLWYFPRKGTSLWDVCAADAILYVLNGNQRICDKFGSPLQYFQRERENASNTNGIIASRRKYLTEKCVTLYKEYGEEWERIQNMEDDLAYKLKHQKKKKQENEERRERKS